MPKPFKNPHYSVKSAGGKRNKSLKQILAFERERVDRVEAAKREERIKAEQEGRTVEWKEGVSCELASPFVALCAEPLKLIFRIRTDATVEAPPSVVPQKKWCDVTGLEVSYGRYG